MEVTDAEAQIAKDTLECAIRDYYQAMDTDLLVSAWVLITHRIGGDDEPIGVLTPTGQSFVLTRGIMDVALQGDRDSQSAMQWADEDDDD